MFRHWSIINIRTTNHIYQRNMFAAMFETTDFVHLVYRCTLEKGGLRLDIYFNDLFLPCRVPTIRGQKVLKQGGHQGISFMFIDYLGPFCNYMAVELLFKSC